MSSSAENIARTAKTAFISSQLVSAAERTQALHEIPKELEANKDAILKANSEDMAVRCVCFFSPSPPSLILSARSTWAWRK
jgi:gamma-glutamyl phosphate reductase